MSERELKAVGPKLNSNDEMRSIVSGGDSDRLELVTDNYPLGFMADAEDGELEYDGVLVFTNRRLYAPSGTVESVENLLIGWCARRNLQPERFL